MDPNLFYVDTERLFEVLLAIVVLSFLIERALALLVESSLFIDKWGDPNIKELLAFGLSLAVCVIWEFDALSVIFTREKMGYLGFTITAAVIAGGSKGSVKLFHDVFGAVSSAQKRRAQARKAVSEP